jgi:hypothetical protein
MKVKIWATRVALLAFALVAFSAVPAPVLAVGTPTHTTIDSSQNPSPACTSVTFTATVHAVLLSPLGLVQFFDGASTMGGPQVLTPDFDDFLGEPIIPTNHSSASVSRTLSGGTHIITAVYVGTDAPSTGGPLSQSITAATSSTAVTSSVNPSVFGQPVTFTAAVSSACSGSPAGSVQFVADGSNVGGPQPVDGTGHATFTTSSLAVGTHSIDATFASSNTDVTGSSGSLTGGQVVTPAATTTAVSSSTNPSEFGAGVTFTATTTVNAPGSGIPTGNVQFQDNGTNLGSPQSLDGAGHAAITTSGLTVGSHVIAAFFTSNSANFNDSSGSTTQVVNKARTTITYDGATTADFHDEAVLSAKLSRTDDGAPIVGKTIAFTMGFESCSAPTDPTGEAACTIIPTEPAGPFTVTATFSTDANYLGSTDSKAFTVTKEETTTTYTGPTVIAQGNPVTLAGRLLEDGTVPIAGRMLTLTLGTGVGSQSCTAGPTDSAGNASCTVASVFVGQGPQPVQAAFAGDPFYLPSADTKSVIIFAFPSRGIFVLGDQTVAGAPSSVTFWGSQWTEKNTLTGGAAPSGFKGFADLTSSTPPSCGGSWTTSSGNSAPPVDTVPAYMGTAVASSIKKNGNDISGNITRIVVVVTDPGYVSDPGHPGTGTIIATYC